MSEEQEVSKIVKKMLKEPAPARFFNGSMIEDVTVEEFLGLLRVLRDRELYESAIIKIAEAQNSKIVYEAICNVAVSYIEKCGCHVISDFITELEQLAKEKNYMNKIIL